MTEKIICECGKVVKGVSIKHAESNLEQHKKSKIHKEIMESKKTQLNKQNDSENE